MEKLLKEHNVILYLLIFILLINAFKSDGVKVIVDDCTSKNSSNL